MSNPNPRDTFQGIGNQPNYYKPSKLTPTQRDEIRQRLRDGETAKVLALEYGVSADYVRRFGR